MKPRYLLSIAVLELLAIGALAVALWGGVEPVSIEPPRPGRPGGEMASSAADGQLDGLAKVGDEAIANTAPRSLQERSAGMNQELAGGVLVYGDLRVVGGAMPISGSRLSLLREGDKKPLFNTMLQADRSSYAWPSVAPGEYELRSYAQGFQSLAVPVVVPRGVAELRVDVELAPSWLLRVALLTPSGLPLHKAMDALLAKQPELRRLTFSGGIQVIALWHEIPASLPFSELRSSPLTIATWRDQHDFRSSRMGGELPARFAGLLEMPELKDAFVAVLHKETILARGAVAAGQQEVELTVDPERLLASRATLRLQVVCREGKPVTDAKVGVNDLQSWSQPTAVDGNGRFEQSNLWPGRFHLSITSESQGVLDYAMRLAPGEITDLGVLVMRPQREIQIILRDVSDEGGLTASVLSLEGPPTSILQARPVTLPVHKGRIAGKLPEGRYRLQVTGRGGARVEFDTRTLGSAPLEVTLRPESWVEIDPAAALGPTRLVLRTVDGVVVYDRWVTWRSKYRQSLLPGSYHATIQQLQGEAREQPIVVGPEGAALRL